MGRRFNSILRAVRLGCRWAMAPLCLGLIAALAVLVVQFFRELAHTIGDLPALHGSDVILAVLKLVDLVLVANLLLMIVEAAAAIFWPDDPEAPPRRGSGITEFAALKPKLFASISAIAAIDLLEVLVNMDPSDTATVAWKIAILLSFVLAGLLIACMDRLEGEKH